MSDHVSFGTRRSFLVGLGATATVLALPGSAVAVQGPTLTAGDGSFNRVLERRKIRFGSSNDQPYAFRNAKTGQIEGIDADMLQYVIEALGIPEREMIQVDFSGLIGGLKARRMDIIADAMYITEKRMKEIDFTDPWYQFGETFVVPKGNPKEIRTWADLEGKRAASYRGTVYQDWVEAERKHGAAASAYPDVPTGLADLAAGRIDCFVADGPVAAWDLKTFPELGRKLEVVADYRPRRMGRIGAGVRKGDEELKQALNWALKKMKDEKKDLTILETWGLGERNRAPYTMPRA
jgi:polar amino acid transport system substrate-binding protein